MARVAVLGFWGAARWRGAFGIGRRSGVGELVRVEVADQIATIRLDRPKMNALNTQVQAEIGEAAAQVTADPAVAGCC